MSFTIRPYILEDIPAIVAVHNECAPMHHISETEMHRDLETLSEDLQRTIFVAVESEIIVGIVMASRIAGAYHPQKFFLELMVPIANRGKGIGSALYQHMVEYLQAMGLTELSVQVSEAQEGAMYFATKHGYQEQKRDFVSDLPVLEFDEYPFLRDLPAGVTIKTFEELDSPDFRRHWFDVFAEVRLDVPRSQPPTPLEFEFIEEQIMNEPDLLRNGTLFAMHEGKVIGFTAAFWSRPTNSIDQWLTAVRREFRGQGIAMTLKLGLIREAKALGAVSIKTDNDSRNGAMLAINDKLGFVRHPAVLSM
jgi:GNAT superfamily N-acetyltransferase